MTTEIKSTSSSLSALTSLVGADFLESYWPHKPFAIHGLTESLKSLNEISFLSSLDTLLSQWPHSVSVHLPDKADESSSIATTSENARKLFKNGMALLFNNVHLQSPVLQKWLADIAAELGLPAATVARCMVYATPDGKGTAPHFDQNVNFVVQLQGTKTWWLEPNHHVENPTERFTMGQELDSELAIYANPHMPTAMTSAREKIVLKPGSVLFVPRGYWHSTEASGEALALNFTYSQPCWVDLFTAALRSRLLQSPEWRELADGVSSQDSARRDLATQKFDFLLAELVEDLPHWQASDILNATEGSRE